MNNLKSSKTQDSQIVNQHYKARTQWLKTLNNYLASHLVVVVYTEVWLLILFPIFPYNNKFFVNVYT